MITLFSSSQGTRFLKNLNIGAKLTIGLGILVALTLLVVGLGWLASAEATEKIDTTDETRVPTALVSSRAQANLLRMLGDVRGYLALGDQEFLDRYNQSQAAFEADLAELATLSSSFDTENRRRLAELNAAFEEWSQFPERLFELRDDQLEREPAYKLLTTDGLLLGGTVLIETGRLIDEQGRREPTVSNISQLADMADFQGTFAAMLSGLRGYVTTRNRTFRGEYEANLTINQIAWEQLVAQKESLTPSQQASLDEIAKNREAFLRLPDQMFDLLESEHWREDLFLFSNEVVPVTTKMLGLLDEMTTDQQNLLQADLNAGRIGLATARTQTLVGGGIAIVLGLALALILRGNIAGPIRRLTAVAEQIRAGDLEAQALVESRDEIGILAETFNNMTDQLRRTLLQVRKEKERADGLLEVVIPIGVELASEKDFDRLLEKMLLEAKTFCNADAGILYLREDERLKFVIVRNDKLDIAMGGTVNRDITFSRLPVLLPVYDDETDRGGDHPSIAAQVAATGTTINIPDAYAEEMLDQYGPGVFDEKTDYRSISCLALPLKNSLGQVLGVLQLINAQDPEMNQIVPFDTNLQQMMESFSSLAVAALEAYIREQQLKQQIQQLRIEIDEAKREKQVSEIVDSDFFQDLRAKARSMRSRRPKKGGRSQDEAS
jgi:CHASE3 domain sensor protein/GAF domain-containing protein